MHPKFKALVEQLEPTLQRLISMEPVKLSSLPRKMPEASIYVFFEDNKPLYVGRTNRMKSRIRYHSRESAKDAPFAFRIARE
jgi:excinuclease UvrABC nuclease subunit